MCFLSQRSAKFLAVFPQLLSTLRMCASRVEYSGQSAWLFEFPRNASYSKLSTKSKKLFLVGLLAWEFGICYRVFRDAPVVVISVSDGCFTFSLFCTLPSQVKVKSMKEMLKEFRQRKRRRLSLHIRLDLNLKICAKLNCSYIRWSSQEARKGQEYLWDIPPNRGCLEISF